MKQKYKIQKTTLNVFFFKSICISFCAIVEFINPTAANAQDTSSLQGNGMGLLENEWIKAGVNKDKGTLGSGHLTSPGILFDPTGSGNFNTTYDYLSHTNDSSNIPHDGFALKVDGANKTNNNQNNVFCSIIGGAYCTNDITGSTSFVDGTNDLTWTGSVVVDGGTWVVENTYSLSAGQKFIGIQTSITAGSDANTVYFAKYTDPDPSGVPSDAFNTDNKLGHSGVASTQLAFAEATVSGYAIGLYSAETNVTAGIQDNTTWTSRPDTQADAFNGTPDDYGGSLSGSGDDALGLTFTFSNVSQGDVLTFSHAYVFGTSLDDAVTSTAVTRDITETGDIISDLTDMGGATLNSVFDGGSLIVGQDLSSSDVASFSIKAGSAKLDVAANQSYSIESVFENNGVTAGALEKIGSGTLTLDGSNTYTGSTTVSVGTLDVTGSLASSVIGVSDGATLKVDGSSLGDTTSAVTLTGTGDMILAGNETIGSLAGAGTVTNGGYTLTTGGNDTSTTYSGVASGTGGLTKAGSGTLTLDGSNTYTGSTTVSVGTLDVTGSLASSVIGVSDGATLKVDGSSLGDTTSAVTLTGTGDMTLAGNETIGSLAGAGTVTNGGYTLTTGGNDTSTTYSGVASGTGGLTKAGSGTLTLDGSNTYTGSTTVSVGTLDVTGSLASSVIGVSDGATLKVDGSSLGDTTSAVTLTGTGDMTLAGNETIGSLAGAGTVTNGGYTLTTGGNDTSTTYSGVASGTGGLTKAGSGTLTLDGSNTYTGSTTILAGILEISADSGIGNSSGGLILNGGTLAITDDISSSRTVSLGANNGTIDTASAKTLSLSNVISGSGSLTKAGSGTLKVTATNTYSGGTTISAGTFNLDGSVSSDITVAAAGTITGDGSTSGTLTASGVIAPGDSIGTLSIEDNVNFAAGSAFYTEIDGLNYSASGGAGTYDRLAVTGATASFGAGGTIIPVLRGISGAANNNFTPTIGDSFRIVTTANASGVSGTFDAITDPTSGMPTNTRFDVLYGGNYIDLILVEAAQTRDITQIGDTISNLTELGGTVLNSVFDGGELIVGRHLTDAHIASFKIKTGAGNAALKVASDWYMVGSHFTDDGDSAGVLEKTGEGTLCLTNTKNDHSGGTIVTAGTLEIASDAVLGASTADLTLNGGTLATIDDIVSNRTLAVGENHGTINTASAKKLTLSGVVSGSGALTKEGDGTLKVTGENTFSGDTTVSEGTLDLSGSLLSNIVVAKNGRIEGNGSSGGTLLASGIIAPGASPGTLSFAGNVAIQSTGTFIAEIDGLTYNAAGGAGTYDRLAVTGAGSKFTAGGTITPVLRGISGAANNNFTPDIGNSFRVVTTTNASGVSGAFETVTDPTSGMPANSRFDVLYGGNYVDLVLTPKSLETFADGYGNQNMKNAAKALDGVRPKQGSNGKTDTNQFFNGLYGLTRSKLSLALLQTSGEIHAFAISDVHNGWQNGLGIIRSSSQEIGRNYWINVSGYTMSVDEDSIGSSYDGTSKNLWIGSDIHETESYIMGLAAGFSSSEVDTTSSGSSDTNTVSLAAYLRGQHGALEYNGILSVNRSEIDTKRTVDLSTGSLRNTSSSTATGAALSAQLGYRYDLKPETISSLVWVRGDVSTNSTSTFTEKGSSVTALKVSGENVHTTDVSLGYTVTGKITDSQSNKGFWNVGFGFSKLINSGLTDASRNMSLHGASWSASVPDDGDLTTFASLGLDMQIGENTDLWFNVSGAKRGGALSKGATIGLRIEW